MLLGPAAGRHVGAIQPLEECWAFRAPPNPLRWPARQRAERSAICPKLGRRGRQPASTQPPQVERLGS